MWVFSLGHFYCQNYSFWVSFWPTRNTSTHIPPYPGFVKISLEGTVLIIKTSHKERSIPFFQCKLLIQTAVFLCRAQLHGWSDSLLHIMFSCVDWLLYSCVRMVQLPNRCSRTQDDPILLVAQSVAWRICFKACHGQDAVISLCKCITLQDCIFGTFLHNVLKEV